MQEMIITGMSSGSRRCWKTHWLDILLWSGVETVMKARYGCSEASGKRAVPHLFVIAGRGPASSGP